MLAEIERMDVMGILAVIAILIGCLVSAYKLDQKDKREAREKEQRHAAELRAKEREVEAEKNRLAQENRRREEQAKEQTQLAIAQAVEELRKTSDDRYRSAISAATLEDLDRRLREAQLMFVRAGRVLSVRVFASPTGWVGIEWVLDPSLPCPPNIILRRDKKIVATEYAYKGVFTDILSRGREYTYSLQAMDGKSDRENDFQFVVKLPTLTQWQRRVGDLPPGKSDPNNFEQRAEALNKRIDELTREDELWEKVRREGHQRIDGSDGPDTEKRRRKASLDAKLDREREKTEPQQS